VQGESRGHHSRYGGFSWSTPGRLVVLGIELVLLLALIRAYSIEGEAFFRIFALASVGFIVHALLPMPLRLPFFVLLCLVGIVLLFGFPQGAWLVGIGLLLILFAHLPVRFAVRLVLILATGVILAAFRARAFEPPWSPGIWPILGSMFMFRLIVYLYDLKNRTAPFDVWRSMAYFFMLPNVCFPLFPVVDYKIFSKGHYQADAFETYQTGVNWIFRGLTQLILYRVVYQYLSPDPAAIDSASAAALYLVRPYLLYLRISGSFHLVIGMMRIFGFNLPQTNYFYFLASSFTDYWRRINIYWKEFLQKIFFNPFYFRFKRDMSGTSALILATCIAFFATWVLHSYQWFWIRGSFPVIWQDIVFWSVMGLVVLVNMIHEDRRGRLRMLGRTGRPLRIDLALALRTIGTFVVITISWAIWSTQSFSELMLVARKLLRPGMKDVMWIAGALIGLGLVSVVHSRIEKRGGGEVEAAPRIRLIGIPIPLSAIKVSVLSAALVFLVYAQLYFYYPPVLANVIERVKNPFLLTDRDAQLLDRGYYEDLINVTRFNPQLAELYKGRPADWERCWAIHRTGGFPTHELLPSREVVFKRAVMRTNRWGMRDREYDKAKPEGTYRIAFVGASHSMGTGVEDDESFENLVEDRLNEEMTPRTGLRYEILNFSVGGYAPLSRLYQLEHGIFEFEPDVFMNVAINDLNGVTKEVVRGATGSYALPWPELREAARAAGIEEGMDFNVAKAKLGPQREQLLGWIYRRMVELCEEHDVLAVSLFIPQPRDESPSSARDIQRQVEVAKESGLIVIDILDAYEAASDSYQDLWIASWDMHANARGHQMLADKLYTEMLRTLTIGSLRPGAGAEE
jgi:D-alanyl-lipoteichoic acid acyltransferase DltB (MBOAT superfamily)